MVNAVVVHGKSGCPWCEKAKEWLAERHIEFNYVAHDDETERQQFYDALGLVNGGRTMPQVLIRDGQGDVYQVGGYDEMVISGIESLFCLNVARS